MRGLALALLALALLPAVAQAHAVLRATVPERGAALPASPDMVELRFSEPVEAKFGAVRVYDAEGRQVQTGETFHPGGRAAAVAVRLKPGLPEGGYTATYRVISADSHPVSSGFVFSVGTGGASGGASVDDLLEGSESGPVTSAALGTARGLQYAAIALGVGVLIFLLLAWRPALRDLGGGATWAAAEGALSGRMRRLLLIAAGLGAFSASAGIVLQGATAAGTDAFRALQPGIIGDILATRFGLVWGLAVLAWLVLGALAATAGVRQPLLLGIPLLLLAALPALSGHASVQSPRWLLLPTNVVHVVAMGAWLGGIGVLVIALRRATATVGAERRTPLLAGVVARFSAMAGFAILAVLATGIVQSIVYVENFGNLIDTAFGRAVLIKLLLFAGICALGFVNRNRLLPRLRRSAADGTAAGRTGVLLRRVLRLELVAGVLVLGVTGALASYAPSGAESAGPFATSAKVATVARLDVTVEPAAVGPNEMHLYLFDPRSGAQYDEFDELTVTASLAEKNIDDLELQATKSGPGHYTVTGASFGVAGDWDVEILARRGEFDAFPARFEVPIE